MQTPQITTDVQGQFAPARGSANAELEPRVCPEKTGSGRSGRRIETLAEGVTLICGDCREIVPTLKFDAVVTDPPYGVANNRGDGKINGIIEGDVQPPDVAWMAAFPAVIWGANNFVLPRSTGWLVWDKTHAKSCEHSQAELAWTNTVRTVRLHREAYHGFMRQRDGWFHPNQKPPTLMAWAMTWLPDGVTVLDPYMGSGTTGLAAIRTGRKFIGIEIDPAHFDVACERIQRALAQGVLYLGGGGAEQAGDEELWKQSGASSPSAEVSDSRR